MRNILLFLILFALIPLALAGNTTEDQGSHNVVIGEFSDNFNDGNENWTESQGTWSAATGQYIQSQSVLTTKSIAPSGNFTNNYELYMTVNVTSWTTSPNKVGFIISDNSTTTANYSYAMYNASSTKLQIGQYLNDVSTDNIYSISVPALSLNTTYNFKAYYNSTKYIHMKIWNNSIAEPSWQLMYQNSNFTIGKPGIFFRSTLFKIDNFSVVGYTGSTRNSVGNYTSWHNWTNSNTTNGFIINVTAPTNTNYTFGYRQNGTSNWITTGTHYTTNLSVSDLSPAYENTDLLITMYGNGTATPEIEMLTFIGEAPPEPDYSTAWQTGLGGEFFQNKTIGSNNSCINQGDGSIGVCAFADNFNDNNYNGWFINESGTRVANNGVVNHTGANGYMVHNLSHSNLGVFQKFKEYGNLTSYIDVLRVRGNTSRNYQLSMGASTGTRATQYSFVHPNYWYAINSSITKQRYLLDDNYIYNAVYEANFKTYHSNISYASALSTPLVIGSNSSLTSGTEIAFGGSPNAAAIISWDEIRAITLDSSGNQQLHGNYSINYTVPGGLYAKNISISGIMNGGNYSLKYRQNGTGLYTAVEGVKTANSTIELPIPYYQSIDIMLEMNATVNDSIWIQNITVGSNSNEGSILLVTSPTGGEIWNGTQNITWTSTNLSDTIVIVITPNDFNSQSLVSQDELDDGVFAFDTTHYPNLTTYKIKVIATTNNNIFDASNNNFTIANNYTFMPPAPIGCSAVNGTTTINISCGSGSGNVTNGMNFSNTNTSEWKNNSYFYANYSGLNETTLYEFRVYAWNNTGMLNLTYTTVYGLTTTSPNIFIPPLPEISIQTTDNFWINTTWIAGIGNTTDDYGIMNNYGQSIHSNITYQNNTVGAHGWLNLTITPHNITGAHTEGPPVQNNTQLQNNLITLTNINSTYTINEGETLILDANDIDLDNDAGLFSDNSSKWNIDPYSGELWGGWTPNYTDSGIYNWQICVEDGYGGTDCQDFVVTVNDIVTPTTPVLSYVQSESCASNSCEITFNVNQSNAITRVRYGATTAMYSSTSNISTGISRSHTLTGLIDGTLYYYTVDAWNSTNNTYHVNSTMGFFNTPGTPPPNLRLSGTVNVEGALITTNPSVGSKTGGAYDFEWVFLDAQTYWINVSKAGYHPNNTQITFDEDRIWNPILTLITDPKITTYNNSYTNNSDLIINVEKNSIVYFNVVYDQPITCSWGFIDYEMYCYSGSSLAWKQFDTLGASVVTFQGTNPNGTTSMLQWNLNVTPISTTYNIQYETGCLVSSGLVSSPLNKLFRTEVLILVVVLLIIIIQVMRENILVGLMTTVVLVVFAGAFLPNVLTGIEGVDDIHSPCTIRYESLNFSGKQDTWIQLLHYPIVPHGERVTNSTYVGYNTTDYQMDYTLGRIKPLSTGNFSFVN